MRSARAVYENGRLVFPEGDGPEGPMEVVVVFSDKSEPALVRDKHAGSRFVEKWSGVLKGVDIDDWKEQRVADLERKHQ